jgi:hypothetical protein
MLTRSRSLGQHIERRLANQISNWNRSTVVILLVFCVYMMLPGGTLAVRCAWEGLIYLWSYDPFVLTIGPIVYDRLRQTLALLFGLGLLFGANDLRRIAFAELKRRTAAVEGFPIDGHRDGLPREQSDHRLQQAPAKTLRPTTAILCSMIGPIVVLWGVVLLLEALTPLVQVLWYMPPSKWSTIFRSEGFEILTLCQLWGIGIGLLLLGALISWKAMRSLLWRTAAGESVECAEGTALSVQQEPALPDPQRHTS